VKLVRKSLNEQLYDQLRQDIIEGKIGFGEKLINRELQQKFGVSSTPVRDAINRLFLDGLLEDITNSGAKVITFDLQFILEVNEVLTLLSCAAVECTAKRADQADQAELCAQLEELLLAQEHHSGTDEYYRYDFLFHQSFFCHCQNRQYQNAYSRYRVLLEMLFRRFYDFMSNHKDSTEQHRQILHFYRLGDIDQAVKQMKAHFLYAEQLFRQYMG